jgi:hypothetical protein
MRVRLRIDRGAPPEIVEDFDREIYGRQPKRTPKVPGK